MATKTKITLADASDATLTESAAQSLKAGDVSALRGMLTAALYLRQHEQDAKKAQNTLSTAFLTVFTEGTAANYVSKARACAMPAHFPWQVDASQPVDAIIDAIMPEFAAYWPDVRSIKRSGPPKVLTDAEKATQKAERKAESDKRQADAKAAADKLGPPLSAATPTQIAEAFRALINRKDGIANAVDTSLLATIRDEIMAELQTRVAEANAKAVAAVDARPLALAA